MAIPPPWPRPVSPLHYEPVIPEKHEIFLEESSSSEEDTERNAKRQRIEQLGESYLRGYGLIISTARIRGPLGRDWKNPWASNKKEHTVQKKKKSDNQTSAKEIPETVQKLDCVLVPNDNKPNQHLPPIERHSKAPHADLRDALYQPVSAATAKASELTAPQVSGRSLEEDPFKSNSAVKSRSKVEDWLKKDHGVTRPRAFKENDGPQSPTARFTAINAARDKEILQPQRNLLDLLQPTKNKTDNVQFSEAYEQANSREDAYLSIAKAVVPMDFNPTEDVRQTTVGPQKHGADGLAKRPPCNTINNNRHPSTVNGRAELPASEVSQNGNEAAKSMAKQQSLHSVPPSSHLPEFKFGRVQRDESDRAEQAVRKMNRQDSSNAPLQAAKEPTNTSRWESTKDQGAEFDDFCKDDLRLRKRNEHSTGEPEVLVEKERLQANSLSKFKEQEAFANILGAARSPSQSVDEQATAIHPPSLTTATSNRSGTIETNNLPSAQMVSNPQNPVSLSSLPSTKLDSRSRALEALPDAEEERVEDSMLNLSTQAAVEKAQQNLQANLVTPKPPANILQRKDNPDTEKLQDRATEDAQHVSNDMKSPSSKRPSQSSPLRTPPEPNTQAMLAAVTPFAFSTTKKVPLKPASVLVTKSETALRKPSKNKKRISFTSDTRDSNSSSQGSIRSALKVKKAPTTDETKPSDKDGHQASPNGDLSLSMDTSAEDEGKVAFFDANTRPQESFPSLSSLLRDSNDHPTPQIPSEPKSPKQDPINHTMQTTTSLSAQQPDAQEQSLHNAEDRALDDEADFDLEATMDDLGSFLQTWDTDKEAKIVGEEVIRKESGLGGSSSSGKWDWKRKRMSLSVKK